MRVRKQCVTWVLLIISKYVKDVIKVVNIYLSFESFFFSLLFVLNLVFSSFVEESVGNDQW